MNASRGSEKPEAKKGGGAAQRLPAELSRVNLNAAGIDVGASSHFAAAPQDRWEQPVREFEAFTADLYRLADWLAECGVETVAMESTGVYWIPPVRGPWALLQKCRLSQKSGFCRKSLVLSIPMPALLLPLLLSYVPKVFSEGVRQGTPHNVTDFARSRLSQFSLY